MRKLKIAMMAVLLSSLSLLPTYASQMKTDSEGAWIIEDDKRQWYHWYWLDGNDDGISECYYFDGNGYLSTNTISMDGYQVNENGMWVVDGVVQTKQSDNVFIENPGEASYDTIIKDVMWGTSIWDVARRTEREFVIDISGDLSNSILRIYERDINRGPKNILENSTLLYEHEITSYYAYTDDVIQRGSSMIVHYGSIAMEWPIDEFAMDFVTVSSSDIELQRYMGNYEWISPMD